MFNIKQALKVAFLNQWNNVPITEINGLKARQLWLLDGSEIEVKVDVDSLPDIDFVKKSISDVKGYVLDDTNKEDCQRFLFDKNKNLVAVKNKHGFYKVKSHPKIETRNGRNIYTRDEGWVSPLDIQTCRKIHKRSFYSSIIKRNRTFIPFQVKDQRFTLCSDSIFVNNENQPSLKQIEIENQGKDLGIYNYIIEKLLNKLELSDKGSSTTKAEHARKYI